MDQECASKLVARMKNDVQWTAGTLKAIDDGGKGAEKALETISYLIDLSSVNTHSDVPAEILEQFGHIFTKNGVHMYPVQLPLGMTLRLQFKWLFNLFLL